MDNDIYIRPGMIYAITTDTSRLRYVEVIGNIRTEKNSQLGIPLYQLRTNTEYESQVLEYINSDLTIFPKTLSLDIETINNDTIMNALNKKIANTNLKPSVRIINQNYTLTKEDYNKLQLFDNIIVDNVVKELENDNRIVLQHGVFKYDQQAAAQPVIERRTHFNELIGRNCFHINHKLTDKEFEILSNTINNTNNQSIELNIFDPNYYDEFFKKLQEYNIPNNINICLIGYPLKDESNVYNNLEKYPYEIDILYSTCHDMVDLYTKEPYVENKLLYSQVEGGGKTSLTNYTNILKTLEDFKKQTEDLKLSPLETAIYAKNYIDNQYIYDPDYQDNDTDDWDNTNLSQILNHDDGNNKRGICLGFATLYSALLRKCEIPMFRYGTTGHARNIGRIKDDKYGIDTVSVFDITWDLEDSAYRFFGISPRDTLRIQDNNGNYENMTIASSFSLPIEDFYTNFAETTDPYELFYHPSNYNPTGYATRILELMGYISENQPEIRFYKELYNLTKEGHFEGIEAEKIIAAINGLARKQGMSEQERENIINNARLSFEDREFIFQGEPAIGGYNYTTAVVNGTPHPVNPLNLTNIDRIIENYNEELDVIFLNQNPSSNNEDEQTTNNNDIEENNDFSVEIANQQLESNPDYIPGTNIPRPRYRGVYETDEEYTEYLEEYYNRVFQQQEENNNIPTPPIPETIDNNIEDMLEENIPGTNIPKPRYRKINETDEEYEQFLEEYYSRYFTEEQMNRGR